MINIESMVLRVAQAATQQFCQDHGIELQDEEEACDHEWEYRPDWGGDDTLEGNGTFDCSTYYCSKCDTEQDDRPDDYEEPFDEPEDYY